MTYNVLLWVTENQMSWGDTGAVLSSGVLTTPDRHIILRVNLADLCFRISLGSGLEPNILTPHHPGKDLRSLKLWHSWGVVGVGGTPDFLWELIHNMAWDPQVGVLAVSRKILRLLQTDPWEMIHNLAHISLLSVPVHPSVGQDQGQRPRGNLAPPLVGITGEGDSTHTDRLAD